MMLSSNICRFVLVLAAACNTVTSAEQEPTVGLGTAGNYVILSKTGISTVPDSVITGDIAVSPIVATAITGFSLTAHSTNVYSESTQVIGEVFAANYAVPTPADLTTAVSNMETAYTDAAGRSSTEARTNIGSGGHLPATNKDGTVTLMTPGVYKFGSDVVISGDITFSGGAAEIFIIQITGSLELHDNTSVILSGGALAKNIFWQVAGAVEVGAGAHMKGILLVQTYVLFETGSSLSGRVLAQTRCDLQVATITEPPSE
jgi:hypothetical protein